MITYQITFDAAAQMELSAGINAKVLPLMNQAVRAIAAQSANNWRESVMRAKLWSGEKDQYVQSIKWKMTGDFSASITSDYKNAAEIETGRGPRDLKTMLDTSQKVRRTKDGRRFLVIPIRHGISTSNSNPMPASVGQLANAMTSSRVTGTGQRKTGQVTHLSPKTGMFPAAKQTAFLTNPKTKAPMMTASRAYAWGDRLTRAALKNAGLSKADQKKYAGMVRMDTTTPGGKKSSSFLTFRIMMEGSNGWIVPAQPGKYLLRGVATDMEPKAAAAFTAAIQKTLGSS